MEEISQHLATGYKEATLISLEEHGIDPKARSSASTGCTHCGTTRCATTDLKSVSTSSRT